MEQRIRKDVAQLNALRGIYDVKQLDNDLLSFKLNGRSCTAYLPELYPEETSKSLTSKLSSFYPSSFRPVSLLNRGAVRQFGRLSIIGCVVS